MHTEKMQMKQRSYYYLFLLYQNYQIYRQTKQKIRYLGLILINVFKENVPSPMINQQENKFQRNYCCKKLDNSQNVYDKRKFNKLFKDKNTDKYEVSNKGYSQIKQQI